MQTDPEFHVDNLLDGILELFDACFWEGYFEVVDTILKNWDVEKVSSHINIGVLCSSLAAKHLLPSRADLLDRIEKSLLKTEDPERVEKLLGGLR